VFVKFQKPIIRLIKHWFMMPDKNAGGKSDTKKGKGGKALVSTQAGTSAAKKSK